jgi:hypothetical protein
MTAIDQLSNRLRDFNQTINKCKPFFEALHRPWTGSPNGTILSSDSQHRKLLFGRYAVESGAMRIDKRREFVREPAEILVHPEIPDAVHVQAVHL